VGDRRCLDLFNLHRYPRHCSRIRNLL
jgi:hypothetical protein